MSALFVYGTLCFPEVIEKLTGKFFHSEPAVLKGFQRKKVRNADYPAIIKNEEAEVKGILFHDVDDHSIQIINFYEGEEYNSEVLKINTTDGIVKAKVFVWNSDFNELEETDWNPNEFQKYSLKIYNEKVIPDTILKFTQKHN